METILVVEDEYPISQVLKAYLKKANFRVVQVYHGDEVMPAFQEHHPSLVLLDVMLPGKSGWELLKELRAKSNCPVIMLTALGDVTYKLEGLNSGADDYISKPFIGEEVIARIKAVLRRTNGNEGNSERKTFGQ